MSAVRRASGMRATVNAPERPQEPRETALSPKRLSVVAEPDLRALSVTVPMPPSTNRLYATVNGRRVKTVVAREYAEAVTQRVWLWARQHGPAPAPPHRLTIVLHPAANHRLDLSNAVKCLEDAVFAGIEGNDKSVVELIVRLGERDPQNPRAAVMLEHVVEV